MWVHYSTRVTHLQEHQNWTNHALHDISTHPNPSSCICEFLRSNHRGRMSKQVTKSVQECIGEVQWRKWDRERRKKCNGWQLTESLVRWSLGGICAKLLMMNVVSSLLHSIWNMILFHFLYGCRLGLEFIAQRYDLCLKTAYLTLFRCYYLRLIFLHLLYDDLSRENHSHRQSTHNGQILLFHACLTFSSEG